MIVCDFVDGLFFVHIYYTVHFGYSGHLGPALSGHYIRLATISDHLNIIE